METDTWNRGPDLSQSRAYFSCNLVNRTDGTQDIVIVGGIGGGTECPGATNTVDIIHLDTKEQALRSGNNTSKLTKVDNIL